VTVTTISKLPGAFDRPASYNFEIVVTVTVITVTVITEIVWKG